jgi:hypothetical protein
MQFTAVANFLSLIFPHLVLKILGRAARPAPFIDQVKTSFYFLAGGFISVRAMIMPRIAIPPVI